MNDTPEQQPQVEPRPQPPMAPPAQIPPIQINMPRQRGRWLTRPTNGPRQLCCQQLAQDGVTLQVSFKGGRSPGVMEPTRWPIR